MLARVMFKTQTRLVLTQLPLRKTLLLAVLSASLVGCGFKLRTWDMQGNVETATLSGAAVSTALGSELRRALGQAGVRVLDSTAADEEVEAAELKLELLAVTQRRRSVSVTGQARAAEYELMLDVNFAARDAQSAQLIAPRWLKVQRVYRVDRDNLVGSNEEESLLQREMRADALQQILRAVNQVIADRASTTG